MTDERDETLENDLNLPDRNPCGPDSAAPPPGRRGGLRRTVGRSLPLVVLMLGLVAFFALDLDRFISFEQLKLHRDALFAWKEEMGIWAPVLFMLGYAVMVSFSIPGGLPATIAIGFLFGIYVGSAIVVIGATAGAIVVFLAARTALGKPLQRRAGPAVQRMRDGFNRNAFSYMLILRLVPIFPFWLVNLVPAILNVPLRVFALGTLIGIIPGVVIYSSLGSGLDELIQAGREPGLDTFLEPEFIIATVGLVALAILPIVYRRITSGNRRA